MRVFLPVLASLATAIGAFAGAYFNAKRRTASGPELRSKAISRMIISTAFALAAAVVAVVMVIAVADL